MQKTRNILLLGSGYMSESVASYMSKRAENHLIIASDKLEEAQSICKKFSNCEAVVLNVTDPKELLPLVERSDLVISYVPAFLHPHVAKACLAAKKHLVTASYVSPAMAEFDREAKAKGLIFLNELGVDPGIDHMATMKIVHEVKAKGGRIVGYRSYCGGLPSPIDCDNPLGYKFSWSPIGAIRALKNSAKLQKGGKVIEIPSADLLFSDEELKMNNALILETYPNRDSIQYIDIYQMKETTDFMRGTLRYKGYCLIMRSMIELGLLSEDQVPFLSSVSNWREFIQKAVQAKKSCPRQCHLPEAVRKEVAASTGLGKEDQKTIEDMLVTVFNNKNYKNVSKEQLETYAKMLVETCVWLGFFDEKQKISPGKTYIEILCALLEAKLQYKTGETDAIFMQHIFKIDWKDKTEIRKSTMILIGEKNGRSAMALSVGYPTGIGAQLILDGKITTPGVVIPTSKEIYEPAMTKLEECGITLKEESEFIYRPKL